MEKPLRRERGRDMQLRHRNGRSAGTGRRTWKYDWELEVMNVTKKEAQVAEGKEVGEEGRHGQKKDGIAR